MYICIYKYKYYIHICRLNSCIYNNVYDLKLDIVIMLHLTQLRTSIYINSYREDGGSSNGAGLGVVELDKVFVRQ